MTDLRVVQDEFRDYLFLAGDAALERVNGTAKATATTLMGVYRDGYALRLSEVLGKDYPATRFLLGDDFDGLARDYLRRHPSRHFSVRWFGRHFPSFVASTVRWRDNPLLHDLARWEWAMGEAFDSPDVEPLGVDALADVPAESWADLRFRLLPSLRRLDLRWLVPDYCQKVGRDEATEPPADAGTPIPWAIWRPRLATEFRSLAEDEAWALDSMLARAGFGEICEGLCRWHSADAAPMRAAGLLRAWIEQGMLAAIDVASASG